MFTYLHFTFPVLLFILIGGHCYGDFVFQNDFVAKAKNHILTPDPRYWVPVLFSHCMVHAMIVLVLTGVFWCAIFMFVTHWIIDFAKCSGLFGEGSSGGNAFVVDQLLHLLVLIVIAIALTMF